MNFVVGTVVKLLRQITVETKIRVDEVKVAFPINSKYDVRERERERGSCHDLNSLFLIDNQTC